jgi:hypothetical protein
VIWERGDQIVQLANQDDGSELPNDHPVVTTPDDIAAMLSMLRMRYEDEETEAAPTPVFTQEEIDNLDNAVAAGLSRAEPTQDIIFYVIGARRTSPGAWLQRNRVSAGRIFFRDGNLNVIFGQVLTPYRKKYVYGQVKEDFYPRDYGSRTKPAKHDVVLLTTAAVHHYERNSQVRNDWLVIDPDVIAAVSAADRNTEPQPTQQGAKAVDAGANSRTSSNAGPPVLREDRVDTDTFTETRDQTTPPVSNVEQRLQALKQLRERELISEEAYQSKMKEILQDL